MTGQTDNGPKRSPKNLSTFDELTANWNVCSFIGSQCIRLFYDETQTHYLSAINHYGAPTEESSYNDTALHLPWGCFEQAVPFRDRPSSYKAKNPALAFYVFASRVSRRLREMYSGHARLSVCVPVSGRMPTLLHGPGCNLGNGTGCPPVVHYWTDFAIGVRAALLWQHSANAKC